MYPSKIPDTYGRKTALLSMNGRLSTAPYVSGSLTTSAYGSIGFAVRTQMTSSSVDGLSSAGVASTFGGCLRIANNLSADTDVTTWTNDPTGSKSPDRFPYDYDSVNSSTTQATWRKDLMASARTNHCSLTVRPDALNSTFEKANARVYMGIMPFSAWANHNTDSFNNADLGWWRPNAASGSTYTTVTESSARQEVALGRAFGPISFAEWERKGALTVVYTPSTPAELEFSPDNTYGNVGGGYSTNMADASDLTQRSTSVLWALIFNTNVSVIADTVHVIEYEPDPSSGPLVRPTAESMEPIESFKFLNASNQAKQAQFTGAGAPLTLRDGFNHVGNMIKTQTIRLANGAWERIKTRINPESIGGEIVDRVFTRGWGVPGKARFI